MKWSLERGVLAASTLVFIGFGGWLFMVPEALAGLGIQLLEPAARIDVRATYGGMELGFAAFLTLCLWHDEWVRTGLVALVCVCAGFGLARLLAIAIEGRGTSLMWSFVLIELGVVLIVLAVLRRGRGNSVSVSD